MTHETKKKLAFYSAVIITGAFCVLAAFAYGRIQPLHHHARARPVILTRYTWKTDKAKTLAEVWNIAPGELEAATNIFGK